MDIMKNDDCTRSALNLIHLDKEICVIKVNNKVTGTIVIKKRL